MDMGFAGWLVAAIAVYLTGLSKAGLGGVFGGLAVPLIAMFVSPRDAAAFMLPILIAIDLFGLRAWKGQASNVDLKHLLPAAAVGIGMGTLIFGVLTESAVKGFVGLIAVTFATHRLVLRLQRRFNVKHATAHSQIQPPRTFWAWLSGGVSGITSTLAHAGSPPIQAYLITRGLSKETYVATTVYYFTAVNLFKVPFYFSLGLFQQDIFISSLYMLPLVPLGVWSGMRLMKLIPEALFFSIATLLLGVSGLKLLIDAWLGV